MLFLLERTLLLSTTPSIILGLLAHDDNHIVFPPQMTTFKYLSTGVEPLFPAQSVSWKTMNRHIGWEFASRQIRSDKLDSKNYGIFSLK